jgi:DNA-binding IscR family transcriptional regulator
MEEFMSRMGAAVLLIYKMHQISSLEIDDAAVEAHAKTCKNPNCEVKKVWEKANKVAAEALKL